MGAELKDKNFISTRPANGADELAGLFANAGATLLEMPLIEIFPKPLTTAEIDAISRLEDFQWLIFTSSNGVKYFFENLNRTKTVQLPATLKIAVIGNKTETVLNDFGYQASFTNPGSTGEDFAAAFAEEIKNIKGKVNILLALGNLARTVIQDKLAEYATCTRINVYETRDKKSLDQKIVEKIENNEYEMILFSSPSGIQNFVNMTNKDLHKKIRIACIGETTAKAAIENNIVPKVVATNSSTLGLFESIVNFYKK